VAAIMKASRGKANPGQVNDLPQGPARRLTLPGAPCQERLAGADLRETGPTVTKKPHQ